MEVARGVCVYCATDQVDKRTAITMQGDGDAISGVSPWSSPGCPTTAARERTAAIDSNGSSAVSLGRRPGQRQTPAIVTM